VTIAGEENVLFNNIWKMSYFPKFCPSFIVSGNCLFNVSGKSRHSNPAETKHPPNITNGRAWPNLPPTRSPWKYI
jgi:hypothetical protein